MVSYLNARERDIVNGRGCGRAGRERDDCACRDADGDLEERVLGLGGNSERDEKGRGEDGEVDAHARDAFLFSPLQEKRGYGDGSEYARRSKFGEGEAIAKEEKQ
jgi:hypothetical protein